jgi:hypothetical protein
MNKGDREYNLPAAFCSCLAIILTLTILFCPALAAFRAAGAQDGFTLDAFDSGPSPWWMVGIVLFFLSVIGLLTVALKIREAARR